MNAKVYKLLKILGIAPTILSTSLLAQEFNVDYPRLNIDEIKTAKKELDPTSKMKMAAYLKTYQDLSPEEQIELYEESLRNPLIYTKDIETIKFEFSETDQIELEKRLLEFKSVSPNKRLQLLEESLLTGDLNQARASNNCSACKPCL